MMSISRGIILIRSKEWISYSLVNLLDGYDALDRKGLLYKLGQNLSYLPWHKKNLVLVRCPFRASIPSTITCPSPVHTKACLLSVLRTPCQKTHTTVCLHCRAHKVDPVCSL
jgi:hypothetical protein